MFNRTTPDLIHWFVENYPNLVKSMKSCDHNYDKDNQNTYHLETDVFTHTMMVLKEATRMELSFNLKIAALLHDIGKFITREVVNETKRVRFFNHEPLSGFLALDILNDPELDLHNDDKINIFKLICLHTEPFKRNLKDLQEEVSDYGLYYSLLKLSEADQNGRFSSTENTKIDYDIVVSKFQSKENVDNLPKVVLLCGTSYSGKSTYLSSVVTEHDYVISRDSIIESLEGSNYNEKWKNANQKQIDKLLEEKFKTALTGKFNTIYIDMTHMSKKSRRKSLSKFGKKYFKECVTFLVPISELNKRSKKRLDKIIDDDTIQGMMMRFYPPVLGEGFDKIEYRMD